MVNDRLDPLLFLFSFIDRRTPQMAPLSRFLKQI